MGAERAKEQTKDQAPAKRRGLFGRLFRLVAFLGVAGAIALVAGFKVQKQVSYPAGDRTVTIEAGKWAWEDTDAFVAYSRYWLGWTREQIVALDHQVGASDKVKAGAGAAADGIKKGYDAVQERIHATPGTGDASAPDRSDLDRQERDEHFGYTERELEKLPAGYYEALKGGHEALRQGIDAHKKWARDRERGTEKAWDLSNAEERFRAAQTNFERCRELYPDDRRPEIQLKLVQEYLHQIAKDRPADY